MDKVLRDQKSLLLDQLFESAKRLIIENLELASTARSAAMRGYYEGIDLGSYCLYCAHSPLPSANAQVLTDLIGYATDPEVKYEHK